MKESPSGHPVLSLTDYDDKKNFPDKFHGFMTQVPDESDAEDPNVAAVLGGPKRRRLQKRVNGLHEAFVADEEVKKKPKRRHRVLEIFTWTMAFAAVAPSCGWKSVGSVSHETGYDLYVPECTPWSQMQNSNAGNLNHRERSRECRKMPSERC